MNKGKRNIVVLCVLILSLLLSDAAFAIGPKKKRQRRKAKTENVSAGDSSEDIDWGTTTVLTDIKVRAHQGEDSLGVSSSVSDDIAAEEVDSENKTSENVEEETPSKEEKMSVVGMTPKAEEVLNEAFSHLGKRYSYGSTGPSTFDCSGFTSYCFRQIGISLPHNSGAQFSCGEKLDFMDEIRPGDLVFFRGRSVASSIGHVGIVIEVVNNGEDIRFIHASTSSGVIVSRYSEDYYHVRYIGARRVLPEE